MREKREMNKKGFGFKGNKNFFFFIGMYVTLT